MYDLPARHVAPVGGRDSSPRSLAYSPPGEGLKTTAPARSRARLRTVRERPHTSGMNATATSHRDAKLLLRELDDVEEALKLNLSAEERRALEDEQEALLHLLDRIEERDFAKHVANLRD